MIKKIFKDISTDGAQISALRKSYAKKHDKDCYRVSLKKGHYLVTLSNNKDSSDSMSEYLYLESDNELIIGDTYAVLGTEGAFDSFWRSCDAGSNTYGKGVSLSLGSDGTFDVKVEIKKIAKAPKDKYLELLEFMKQSKKEFKKIKDIELMEKKEKEISKNPLFELYYKKKFSHEAYEFITDLRLSCSEKRINNMNKIMDKILNKN